MRFTFLIPRVGCAVRLSEVVFALRIVAVEHSISELGRENGEKKPIFFIFFFAVFFILLTALDSSTEGCRFLFI